MFEFENLLRIAMQGLQKDTLQNCKLSGNATMNTACENQNQAVVDKEICALAKTFGELKAGKTIETTLQEMLQVLPRQRKRSDAYKGVIAKLKQLGVTLIIKKKKEGK